MLNQYLVTYRTSAVEEFGANARTVRSHKLEGWREDYAFFGHPTQHSVVTLLIPRQLVKEVELTFCEDEELSVNAQRIQHYDDKASHKRASKAVQDKYLDYECTCCGTTDPYNHGKLCDVPTII